jgi:hypothetical protein
MREYYFRRRHLAWGRGETGHRRLKYEIERDWLSELMYDDLAFIKERDGAEILKEISVHLLIELLESIEYSVSQERGLGPESAHTPFAAP